MNTTVYLKHGSLRGPLTLRRLPPLLRFVVTGSDWRTLDALDQLDDEPRPGEHVIPAERGEVAAGIACTRGKGGGCVHFRTVTYTSVPDPPPQEVLTSTARWRAWCMDRVGKAKQG